MNAPPFEKRPMSVGELLGGTWRLYRDNALTFLGIVAPVMLLVVLGYGVFFMGVQQYMLSMVTTMPDGLPDALFEPASNPVAMILQHFWWVLLLSLVFTAATYGAMAMMYGALVNATAHRVQQVPISIIGAYRPGGHRMLHMVGMALVGLLAMLLLITPLALLFFSFFNRFMTTMMTMPGSEPDMPVAPDMGFVFFFPLWMLAILFIQALLIVVAAKFLFVPQAVVLEGHGLLRAFGRSWSMTRGFFWRTLGIMVLVFLIVLLITQVLATPIMLVSMVGFSTVMFTMPMNDPDAMMQTTGVFQGVGLLLNLLVTVPTYPIYGIAFTLLYYDTAARSQERAGG